jgi:hypothetical protein
MFLVRANAQITPSNEKLPSNTSKYKNVPKPHANNHGFLDVSLCLSDCNNALRDETMRNVTKPVMPATKKFHISSTGK